MFYLDWKKKSLSWNPGFQSGVVLPKNVITLISESVGCISE
jgi:hypothetical protein